MLSNSTYVGRSHFVLNKDLEEYKRLIKGNPEEQRKARELAFYLSDTKN
jgi:hypothetical protein